MKCTAVILAGGTGARMGAGVPKQLLRIAGKTVIEHTVAALESAPEVDDIIVMMEPSHLSEVSALLSSGAYSKFSRVFPGGSTRNETTRLAIDHLGDEEQKVLLHDAVRPFLDNRIVADCVEALDRFQAVDTAIPSADTVIRVARSGSSDHVIRKVPPRHKLRRGQTPQGFHLSVLRRAYELAAERGDTIATDDCTVVLRHLPDVPIAVVEGSDENIKITTPVDIAFADKLFQLRSTRVANLSDEERLDRLRDKVIVVLGGSSGIGEGIVRTASRFGASVVSLSRSASGTHVESTDQVREAFDAIVAKYGRVDGVVLTAGSLDISDLSEMETTDIHRSLEVNLLGPINVAREALPHLTATNGHLLFFTSSSYTRGRSGYSIYSAAKAATVNLTQALAEEWSDAGVKVNCINPQRTRTEMRLQAFGPEEESSLLTVDEVADTSLDTLMSDLTGQVIDVRVT